MAGAPPPSPPVEAEGLPEGGEEQRRGLTPRQQRVSNLLSQLATTARSFLLYDPRNEAIHQFLATLLDSLVKTLAEFDQIQLSVQPFEIHFEGQAVYVNRDREKSLAFRLYRDGVRGLTLRDGFEWEQLSRLLEVLSVRYTGVHHNEDDMVTLLWKANLTHLEVMAVEGFVPEDEMGDDPGAFGSAGRTSGEGASADELSGFPESLDIPLPSLPRPERVAWIAVPEAELERLRSEVSASTLPGDCLKLLDQLRQLLGQPVERLRFADVAHMVTEIRDFLLADEHLLPLSRCLRMLREMALEPDPDWDPGRSAAVAEVLASSGDYRAILRLLHSVPGERRQLHPELIEVLDLASPDPLSVVAMVLAGERSVAARAVARQLLEHYGKGHVDDLTRRFREASGTVAGDLLRVIAHVGGGSAATTIAQQAAHPEHEVQEEALWHIERMPYSGAIGRLLFDAYRRAEVMRGRILAIIAKSGDRRFAEFLARHLEDRAARVEPEEAERVGQVIGKLGGAASLPRWQEWLKPAGLLKKTLNAPLALQVAGAAAVSEIPGDAAAQVLRTALAAAGAEAHSWLGRAVARHQRGASQESR